MVELIRSTKDAVLERLDKSISEKGADRMNVQEVGMLADVVKDLAEAEKSCWEAEYYHSVTDAMHDGSMGYEDAMDRRDGMGYRDGQRGPRMGYRGQPRDSQGRYSRRGYRPMDGYGHDDVMMDVREMMDTADPQEREEIRRRLREMVD